MSETNIKPDPSRVNPDLESALTYLKRHRDRYLFPTIEEKGRPAFKNNLELASNDQVLSDVLTAYEAVRDNDQVVTLYRSGYLDEAQQDRDISEYAYKRGAASLLDFLDAERSYRATELAYRQALAAYLLSVEQLREAVGTRSLP